MCSTWSHRRSPRCSPVCCGRGLWKVGDVGIIDGLLVNGSAKLVGLIGSLTRLFQTGYLYHYALVMILGVFALMTWFVFMHP